MLTRIGAPKVSAIKHFYVLRCASEISTEATPARHPGMVKHWSDSRKYGTPRQANACAHCLKRSDHTPLSVDGPCEG